MKKLTPAQAKKLRLLLLLIIFAGGLTGLFFAASTLGKSFSEKQQSADTTKQAFNTRLPEANLPEAGSKSKLESYMEAQRDSIKKLELARTDPYANTNPYDPAPPYQPETPPYESKAAGTPERKMDNNEKKVNDKLAELYKVINQSGHTPPQTPAATYQQPSQTEDIARLEQLLAQSQAGESSEDPEMQQLNKMLDKLIAIQHPEQITSKDKQHTGSGKPRFKVTATPDNPEDTLLQYNIPVQDGSNNGFYGLAVQKDTSAADGISFTAVVHQNQTLVNGSTVKMRLTQDLFIKGKHIPKNSFVYGSCNISDERLHIAITSVLSGATLYPVRMEVYDTDGQEGIFVPGAISRDAAKENADRAIQTIGLSSLDPSLSAQAAQAGLETAKTFLSRKVKNITVTIKAGHSILLKNTDNN
ncbi:conjugative transposon TraM protein [Filimonas zeae]|uniref:Conjugative transposon protein TraM n=1 Tax=Filimonas zeae TaxID=1737353 RepID=A0A917IP65_9BACT|nr:conjugative transposon protein TraM [Filimonas zeae]MDR6337678.1 conjugative transposon TraM protein [Filimonas zeae]GGH59748.1 conjugative transposon protein TraM [Filimonas zeae]